MKYYDIHTHLPASCSGDIVVINHIIGKDPVPVSSFLSVGIHPWYIPDVNEYPEQLEQLKEMAFHPKVIAIGEAGLDKQVKTDLNNQEKVFLLQALIAEKVQKPLIIHCVNAWTELIESKKVITPEVPWIIHGFRKKGELARQLIKQGFYLSFGVHHPVEALQAAWPDRLFVETDDSRAEIRFVYQQVAASLQIEVEVLASQIEKNVKKVFDI